VVPQATEDGYEGFEEMIERTNTWLKDQCDILVVNMQSIMVQKDDDGTTTHHCNHSAPDREAEYCDVRMCVCVCVCLSVCPRSYLRNYMSDLHRVSAFLCMLPTAVANLLWRRCDMLCTSGFMDGVMFAHKPRLLDVAAQLKRSAHAALVLAINCAQ